jgi:integrase
MANKAWVEPVRDKGRIKGYRVRYSDANGNRQSEKGIFAKWHDADALAKAVENRLFNGRLGRVDPNLSTEFLVTEFLHECASGVASTRGKTVKSSTLKIYQSNLKWLIRKAPKIIMVDEACIKELKSEMYEADLMPGTIAGHLKDFRTFLGWCKRRKYIAIYPFENIGISEPPSLPRFYTDEEIAAFDKAALGGPFHLAYWLGLKCGLRRSEVLRADKRDIRWLPDGTGELLMWADETKNGHPRNVPLPESVMQLIGSRGSGLLYPEMNKYSFAYAWAKLKVKAGILERPTGLHKRYKWAGALDMGDEEEKARFHDLRHTFCRMWLETRGAKDIAVLASVTGHKSLDVLYRVYAHFGTGPAHEAMKAIEARPKFQGVSRENIITLEGSNGPQVSDVTPCNTDIQRAEGDVK